MPWAFVYPFIQNAYHDGDLVLRGLSVIIFEKRMPSQTENGIEASVLQQFFLMVSKINLENATFMFSTVRGEGGIAKCIPGQQ